MTDSVILFIVGGVVALVAVIVELSTFCNYSFGFAGGGLAAIIANIGLPQVTDLAGVYELLIFLFVSLSTLTAGGIISKSLSKKFERVDENAAILSQKYTLLKSFSPQDSLDQLGQIIIGDVTYSVEGINKEKEIVAGTKVKIVKFEGNRAIVEEII